MARPKKRPAEATPTPERDAASGDEDALKAGTVTVLWTPLGEKKRAWAGRHMPKAGDELQVSPHDADMLIDRGFAERC